jgi:Zn-finger nucleic acid-binding protein
MRQLSLEKAGCEVDVCGACGGIWVDWFDGEVRAIAAETLRAGADASGSARSETDGVDASSEPRSRPSRNEPAAIGACPRCNRQLVSERYEVKTEVESARVEGRTSVVTGKTGAELLRCEDCMGSFVSRTSAEVLAWLSPSDEPPPSQSAGAELKPLPWRRFVLSVKRALGLE